ncbi:MAG: SdpI family protein, partial [Candidatus Eiseniibacteriota bacterium]
RFIGVRTRATLGDPAVWYRVNRRFGRLLEAVALPMLLGLFVGRYGLLVALGLPAIAILGFLVVSGGGRRA